MATLAMASAFSSVKMDLVKRIRAHGRRLESRSDLPSSFPVGGGKLEVGYRRAGITRWRNVYG